MVRHGQGENRHGERNHEGNAREGQEPYRPTRREPTNGSQASREPALGGTARQASAISAGALAVALGLGMPALLATTPAQAADCDSRGLLSGVTSSVCDVVDGATDVVDGVTGGTSAPATDAVGNTVDATVSTANSAVGGTVDTAVNKVGRTVAGAASRAGSTVGGAVGGAGTASSASPVAGGMADGLTEAVRSACLPLVAGPRCDQAAGARPAPDRRAPAPRPTPSATTGPVPTPSKTVAGTLQTEPLRPKTIEPQAVDWEQRLITVERTLDPDDAGITLLWPGQYIPGLINRLDGEKIRPRAAHDGAGTALTAVLLLSAVLATRVVAARRARAGQPESIPLAGMRLPNRDTGRHRLA